MKLWTLGLAAGLLAASHGAAVAAPPRTPTLAEAIDAYKAGRPYTFRAHCQDPACDQHEADIGRVDLPEAPRGYYQAVADLQGKPNVKNYSNSLLGMPIRPADPLIDSMSMQTMLQIRAVGLQAVRANLPFDPGTPEPLNTGSGAALEVMLATQHMLGGVPVQLSAGLRIDHTSQEFANFSGDFIDTTGVMGIGTAGFFLNDKFQVYAGGGLGAISVNERYAGGGQATAPGFVGLLGGALTVAPNISLVGELSHEGMFSAADPHNGGTVTTGTTTFGFGIQLDFDTNGLDFRK